MRFLVEQSTSRLEFARVYHGMTPEEFLALPLRSRSRIFWLTVISTSSGSLCQRTMRALVLRPDPGAWPEILHRPGLWESGKSGRLSGEGSRTIGPERVRVRFH